MKQNSGTTLLWCMMAILTAGLFSCNDEERNDPLTKENELHIGVQGITTRALENAFTSMDRIGLFAVGSPGELLPAANHADNIGFTLVNEAEDTWVPDETVYYPADGNPLDLYAYYPYADPIFKAGSTLIPFRIKPDQKEYVNYTNSDLVIAEKKGVLRSANKVNLTFDHKLSRMAFALKAGEGFTVDEIKNAEISILNAIIDATYDLAEGISGIPVAGEIRDNIFPTGEWLASENDASAIYGKKAIIIPQELNQDTYIQIKLGARTFFKKFQDPITLHSGDSRDFIITLNNSELEISTTLNPWNNGDPIEGEAGEENQYEPDAFVWVFDVPETKLKTYLGLKKDSYQYDFWINWGDGSAPEHITNDWPESFHIYPAAGTYEVSITGLCEYIYFSIDNNVSEVKQWGNVGIKTWSWTFEYSKKLRKIPPYMPDAESFQLTFRDCESLTHIPKGLFDNCTQATSFLGTFRGCRSLAVIPEGLFDNCANAENFNQTFALCNNLGNIPGGLFDNCTQAASFNQTFNNCKGLTSVPQNLFSNCTAVTDFSQVFSYCTGITTLPDNLFQNCANVTSFEKAFTNCTSLPSIPESLFEDCPQAINFTSVFHNCTSLTGIPQGLFDNCVFANKWTQAFAGCASLTGVTPTTNGVELWQRSAYPEYPDEIGVWACFRGCTQLDNYNDIPADVR